MAAICRALSNAGFPLSSSGSDATATAPELCAEVDVACVVDVGIAMGATEPPVSIRRGSGLGEPPCSHPKADNIATDAVAARYDMMFVPIDFLQASVH